MNAATLDHDAELTRVLALGERDQIRLLRRLVGPFPKPLRWTLVAQAIREETLDRARRLAGDVAAKYEPTPETPIRELVDRRGLSARFASRLEREGVRTLSDLRTWTWATLHELPFSSGAVETVAAYAWAAGVRLRET